MTTWSEVFYALTGRPTAQASLIGLAWIAAGKKGDTALLSNLLHNMLNPAGVCQSMDFAGVAVPQEAIPSGLVVGPNTITGGWIGKP